METNNREVRTVVGGKERVLIMNKNNSVVAVVQEDGTLLTRNNYHVVEETADGKSTKLLGVMSKEIALREFASKTLVEDDLDECDVIGTIFVPLETGGQLVFTRSIEQTTYFGIN